MLGIWGGIMFESVPLPVWLILSICGIFFMAGIKIGEETPNINKEHMNQERENEDENK